MSRNVVARKEPGWLVVCDLPDVCKTPCGSSCPPVPYQVTAHLEESVAVVASVRANGYPVVVFDQSKIPTTIGDAPGTAMGLSSGTVEGNCYPMTYLDNVRAGKKYLIRHDDKFWMNGA